MEHDSSYPRSCNISQSISLNIVGHQRIQKSKYCLGQSRAENVEMSTCQAVIKRTKFTPSKNTEIP